MPKRTDIKSVMVIGSGPIVIGQAAEFDYSGTQACRVLREEGIRVILVNSNPATIMTDPEMADATYIEPIATPILEQIIAKERPDALLPTLGGQTALNAAMALGEAGVLKKYNVELIGASLDAIDRGEDRELFKKVVEEAGAESARSDIAHSLEEVDKIAEKFGYPLVVRPSFTMGGLGSGIAHNEEELHRIAGAGIHYSPTDEVLIEEGIEGWKEFELELMRDRNDNVVVVCPIENVDPVGVHTGDSITVAPCFTLTDREYQKLRDIGIAIIRGVGVDTGGCNIQFAVHPDTGRIIVIEMNPRVSRSSALASKATGFPIAKIATKLALGYTLDEIRNDITQSTPASFEPTIDYVVTKVPRFAFEKFPGADPTLTTSMKSVGEAMALAGNFQESLGKAMRSIDKRHMGFNWDGEKPSAEEVAELLEAIHTPTEHRYLQLMRAIWGGATLEQVFAATKIDPWFLKQIFLINETAMTVREAETLTPWIDPTNADQSLMRARIRHSVLPYLEEHLGGDVARSLARTAAVAGPDADYLDEQAREAFERVLLPAGTAVRGIEREDAVLLDRAQVAALHPALRLRVLAAACKAAGGENPGFERLQALDSFTAEYAVAGPVQMPGHVSAYRRRRVAHPVTGERVDALVLVPTRG